MAWRRMHRNLTVQVLTAIVIGLLIGHCWPNTGVALQPLGDGFIRLIKMVVGPIIFLTIVVGIASIGDLKKVGRVGFKALLYFEIVTTLALGLGMLVMNLLKPGAGIHAHAAVAEAAAKTAEYAKAAQGHQWWEFFYNIIPGNIVETFAKGDLLQILFFSVLFGTALASLGDRGKWVLEDMKHLSDAMFRVVAIVMKLAPLGALGAMAFTIGKYGIASLRPLAMLMGCVYLTMALFIFLVLHAICRLYGISLWRYLAFIKGEILLVLGTSSSESALPRMMERLEQLGCSRGVVGLVIPAGYSFNLDGTSIYLSMAVLFIAQAFGIQLGFVQQVTILGILMLTSKGAAGVTGSGFVTLAATLAATHVLPVEGLALLLGVDRFMSEARAITNLIGNGIATMVVAKMEGEFDEDKYHAALHGHPAAPAPATPPAELEPATATAE